MNHIYTLELLYDAMLFVSLLIACFVRTLFCPYVVLSCCNVNGCGTFYIVVVRILEVAVGEFVTSTTRNRRQGIVHWKDRESRSGCRLNCIRLVCNARLSRAEVSNCSFVLRSRLPGFVELSTGY